MVTQRDLINYVESLAGHSLREDEGPRFGLVQQEVTGVTVCWIASPEAIKAAAAAGHNLIICHEALTFPYPSFSSGGESPWLAWDTNVQRLSLLGANGIAACRMHGTLDELFIYEAFAEQLGLTDIVARGDVYYERVYSIDPMRYADLIEKVKQDMGMKALRATPGDPDRMVRTVGLPWGGLGLFVNVFMPQRLMEMHKVDVMICGETDNCAMRFCTELGVDVIETSHELGEVRGLALFAELLAGTFEGLDVRYHETPVGWQMY